MFSFLLLHKTQLTHTHKHTHTCTFSNITTPIQRLRNYAEICMTRIQSTSAIKGRTYARPAQLQLHKGVTYIHIKSCSRGRGRLSHYSVYFITAVTNTHRGGGMEEAIFRACVSALFEGDFGLARVVIGYTYKCIFLPLPHILSKALYHPDPLLSPHASPRP